MLVYLADSWPLLPTLLLAAALPLALMPLLGRRRRLGGGTHVLITGGSKGLGLALARLCVEQGCAVTVVARSQTDLEEARRQLEAAAASAAALAGTGGAGPHEPAKVQALSSDTGNPEEVGGGCGRGVAGSDPCRGATSNADGRLAGDMQRCRRAR